MTRLWLLATTLSLGCGSTAERRDAVVDGDRRCTVCPAAWGASMSGCTDTRIDPWNCGSCGNICSSGGCSAGHCVASTCDAPCVDGVCCSNGGCTNPNRDPDNCGACGRSCGPGGSCNLGECVCGPGTLLCGDTCVDTQDDRNNCGGCGRICGSGTVGCQGGTCTTCAQAGLGDCGGTCKVISFDNNNCGACGHVCEPDTICVSQTCVSGTATCDPGCGSGLLCCAADAAHVAPYCSNVMADTANCGGCGNVCQAGFECLSGWCQVPSGGDD